MPNINNPRGGGSGLRRRRFPAEATEDAYGSGPRHPRRTGVRPGQIQLRPVRRAARPLPLAKHLQGPWPCRRGSASVPPCKGAASLLGASLRPESKGLPRYAWSFCRGRGAWPVRRQRSLPCRIEECNGHARWCDVVHSNTELAPDNCLRRWPRRERREERRGRRGSWARRGGSRGAAPQGAPRTRRATKGRPCL